MDPGSTTAPDGIVQATWKFDVKTKWKHTLGDAQVIGSIGNEAPFLTMSPEYIYEEPTEARLKALEKYHLKTLQPGEQRPLPPAAPLEKFYLMFVDAHIDAYGHHVGRDTTTDNINKVRSSTFIKELIADLIKACPGCNTRDNTEARKKTVDGSRDTREKKKSKRPANRDSEVESDVTTKRIKSEEITETNCNPVCASNYEIVTDSSVAMFNRTVYPTPPSSVSVSPNASFARPSEPSNNQQMFASFRFETPQNDLIFMSQAGSPQAYGVSTPYNNLDQISAVPLHITSPPDQQMLYGVSSFGHLDMDYDNDQRPIYGGQIVDYEQEISASPEPFGTNNYNTFAAPEAPPYHAVTAPIRLAADFYQPTTTIYNQGVMYNINNNNISSQQRPQHNNNQDIINNINNGYSSQLPSNGMGHTQVVHNNQMTTQRKMLAGYKNVEQAFASANRPKMNNHPVNRNATLVAPQYDTAQQLVLMNGTVDPRLWQS